MSAPDDMPTSATLLRRLRDPGDKDAWAAFAENYGRRIYAWCRRWNLQEADAEDVTQGLLVKIPTKMRSFHYDPKVGSFRAWLKTVTRHAWSDFVEARQRPGRGSGADDVVEILMSVEAREELVKQIFSVLGSPSLGQIPPRKPLHEIGVHDDGAHRAGAADR